MQIQVIETPKRKMKTTRLGLIMLWNFGKACGEAFTKNAMILT